jgi:hypothetical protein
MTSENDDCCRICGFRPDTPPWGPNGQTPSFEICPSCGVEYGYEDSTLAAVSRYRKEWLKNGGGWSDASVPKDGLTSQERLRNIPRSFRSQ